MPKAGFTPSNSGDDRHRDAATGSQVILEVRDLSKSFAGIPALTDVQLTLRGGTVHAVIGHNGAGKSTLMKIVSGVQQPSAGVIFLRGQEIHFGSPRDAHVRGVSMVHQELSILEDLNIAENIFLGREPRTRAGLVDRSKMSRAAALVLQRLKLDLPVRAVCRNLNVGERQMVEIARAVSWDCSVLILDEPTAALSKREQDALFELIGRLKASGIGILYISHRLDEILSLADVVTVLRDGKNAGEVNRGEFDHAALIQMMLGRSIEKVFDLAGHEQTNVLDVAGLSSRSGKLKNIGLTLAKGEIVGLAGMLGSGRSELFECLFGMRRYESGSIVLDGAVARPRSPKEAMAAGIGMVPEDRKQQGIFAEASVWRNLSIASISDLFSRFGVVNEAKARSVAADQVRRLNVRCASVNQSIVLLSGGNQQKAILGRWVMREPKILLLDEPTAGIDIGAKTEIYALVRELAARGMGLLVASSEFDELIGLCHRVLVMRDGEIIREMDGKDVTEHALAVAATGGGYA
jgi:ribose transport system ATP-binding protein